MTAAELFSSGIIGKKALDTLHSGGGVAEGQGLQQLQHVKTYSRKAAAVLQGWPHPPPRR